MAASEDESTDGSVHSAENKTKKYCNICEKGVAMKTGVSCIDCSNIAHKKCLVLVINYLKLPSITETSWKCNMCTQPVSPVLDKTVMESTFTPDVLRVENAYLKEVIKHLESINLIQSKLVMQLEGKTVMTTSSPNNKLFSTVVKTSEPATGFTQDHVLSNEVRGLRAAVQLKSSNNENLIKVMAKDDKTQELIENLKSNINLAESNIKVDGLKSIKNGIVIKCPTQTDSAKLCQIINEKLGSMCTAEKLQKKNPKIIVFGVQQSNLDVNNPEIFISELCAANQIDDKETCKYLRQFTDKKGKTNLIIEVAPEPFKKIMKTKSLYHRWQKYACEETFNVLQCFSCNGFGHTASKCNNITCYKCAGNHKHGECKEVNNTCVNCISANARLNLQLRVNHNARDKINCPCYLKAIETVKNHTNYL
jgi:hypothetical protein